MAVLPAPTASARAGAHLAGRQRHQAGGQSRRGSGGRAHLRPDGRGTRPLEALRLGVGAWRESTVLRACREDRWKAHTRTGAATRAGEAS